MGRLHNQIKLNLADQIKIEETLYARVVEGELSTEFSHFLATHPTEYREFKESDEDLKRLPL